MSEERERKIEVQSIYGRANRLPLVNIVLPDGLDRLSLHVDEARHLAMNLLEAAEAAVGDGFVVEFFTREMDCDEQMAGALLLKLRGYRTKHEPEGT